MASAALAIGKGVASLFSAGGAAGTAGTAAGGGLATTAAGAAKSTALATAGKVAGTAATVLSGASAVHGALNQPRIDTPNAVPEPDENQLRRVRQREAARRQGRASTILTDRLG